MALSAEHSKPLLPAAGRAEWLWLLVYLAAALLLFMPALKSGVHLYGTDTVSQKYLFYKIGWEHIRETGRLPLWNPYVFGGIPFLASFALCPFFPTTWLMGLIAFPLAFTLHYALSHFLAGCSGFFGFRLMGMRSTPAALGGLIFQLHCHFSTLVYPGHVGKFPAIACFPLIIGAVVWALRERRTAGFIIAGAGMALQIFASHMQVFYYTALTAAAYGVYAFFAYPDLRKRETVLGAIRGYGLLLVVCIGLSAIYLLPALETSARSIRAGGLSYDEATRSSYPRGEIGEWLFPLYTGDSLINTSPPARGMQRHGMYFGAWGERLVSDYLGIGVFILALWGIFIGNGRDRWFWLAVGLMALELSFGKYSNVFPIFFKYFPGFDRFRSPATIMFLVSFPVIYMFTLAIDRLWRGDFDKKSYIWLYSSLTLLILIFIAAMLSRPMISVMAREDLQEVFKSRAIERTANFGLLACVLLTGALISIQKFRNLKWATGGVIVIVGLANALDLFLIDRQFIIALPHKAFQQAQQRFQPLYFYLQQKRPNSQPYRMLEIGKELSNIPMMSGIGSLHGYHPVAYRKYSDMVTVSDYYHPTISRLLYLQLIASIDPNHERLEGFQPLPALISGLPLYARSSPMLYAWFPQTIIRAADEADMLDKTARIDPYREAVALDARADEQFGNGDGCKAVVNEYGFNRVSVYLEVNRKRPLVVSEYNVTGWRATLDGYRSLPIRTADYFLRMVEVPPGRHVLEFVYEPDSYRTGAFISLLTLGALAGIIFFRRRESGRSVHTEPGLPASAP